ncbi:ABC transporter permease [Priestia aryabhattai]|uniref:ABC transporter permease n=1 Tax=Priestia TaxID=2800373 RepID=UPI003982D2B6
MKEYNYYYNSKEDKYYLDKSFPQKKKKKPLEKRYNNKKESHPDDNPLNINDNSINLTTIPLNTSESIQSAFRALANFNQPVTAFTPIQLRFTNEQFDLNDEYDLLAFVPKQRGVYSIEASALFSATNFNVSTSISISIHVNNVRIADSTEIFVPTIGAGSINSAQVSIISELQAGDRVEVFFFSSQNGTVFTSSPFTSMGTDFGAARFPSPTT